MDVIKKMSLRCNRNIHTAIESDHYDKRKLSKVNLVQERNSLFYPAVSHQYSGMNGFKGGRQVRVVGGIVNGL